MSKLRKGFYVLSVIWIGAMVGALVTLPPAPPQPSMTAPAPIIGGVLLGENPCGDGFCYDDLAELPAYELFPAIATPPAVDLDKAPFHCYLSVRDAKSRTISWGSGTVIYDNGRFAAVLTASHVFDDSEEPISVMFPGGGTYPARMIVRDKALDYAVVAIHSPGREPAKIAPAGQVGGKFRVCGFGMDRTFKVVTGSLSGGLFNPETKMESATLDVGARQGDSGGGVFNEKGELAGVVWGSNGAYSAFVSVQKAKGFIQRAVERVDKIQPLRGLANRLVVVTTDACIACERLKPSLRELLIEGYAVEVVDASVYVGHEVRRYPTLLFYSGPRLVQRWEGYLDKPGILGILRK